TIDLAGVAFDSAGTVQLLAGNILKVVENAVTYQLNLDSEHDYSAIHFRLLSDGHGGTDIVTTSPPNDINGDGFSDLLWRRAADGQTALREMNSGTKLADVNVNASPTEWSIQDTADFNGDGRADILWRRASDGQTVLWEMNGGTKLADVNLNAIPTEWTVQG